MHWVRHAIAYLSSLATRPSSLRRSISVRAFAIETAADCCTSAALSPTPSANLVAEAFASSRRRAAAARQPPVFF
eukprot:COSAG01_NODE_1574_length_9861_cov_8.255071_12_plen_74_part_01